MRREKLLARKIENLRTDLENSIEKEKELIAPEVVKASQSLDKVLIQYYRALSMRGVRFLKGGAK
jgi:hypothetical protein